MSIIKGGINIRHSKCKTKTRSATERTNTKRGDFVPCPTVWTNDLDYVVPLHGKRRGVALSDT